MDRNDRGTLRTTAAVAVVLVVLGTAIVAGFVVANDDPTGSDVLSDVEDRYDSADSVVVDATVTAEHNGTVTEFDVSTVTTDSGQIRVNVSNGTEYVVFGHTENTSWVTASTRDAPVVIRDGTVAGQPSISHETNASVSFANRTDWSREHPAFTPENLTVSTLLEETNATAEFVETTSIDGRTVHVVELSSPERDGRVTFWATTDTATVLKYRTVTPNGTMTADVTETHFDVSPAESTFQPPTDDSWQTKVDSRAELRANAAGPVAVPGEAWSFETGSVLASPVSAVVSRYETDGANLSLVQSNASALSGIGADGRTVEVADRTVTVTEGDDGTTVARWSRGETTVVVVSDSSESELLDAVAGVRFVSPDG
jgi:hypothetical protein